MIQRHQLSTSLSDLETYARFISGLGINAVTILSSVSGFDNHESLDTLRPGLCTMQCPMYLTTLPWDGRLYIGAFFTILESQDHHFPISAIALSISCITTDMVYTFFLKIISSPAPSSVSVNDTFQQLEDRLSRRSV